MKKIKKLFSYFSTGEVILWIASVLLIIIPFLIFKGQGLLAMINSLIGVTALIFCAKGNPIGQVLMIVFCIIYAIISLSFKYYGEMITYLFMSLPMAIVSLIAWLKNPFGESKLEVKVNSLTKKETVFMFILTAIVTIIFYFVLKFFNTANLIPSTISIATSFLAGYLIFRRTEYYALAYALNDVVLIWLWILATIKDFNYISVVICFVVFLFNDLYGFINWSKMKKRQQKHTKSKIQTE